MKDFLTRPICILMLGSLNVTTASAQMRAYPPARTVKSPESAQPADVGFDALRGIWSRSLHDKDADAIMALYANDAAFIQPDSSIVKGSAAIRDLMKQVMSAYDSNIVMTPDVVDVSGHLAFDQGTYRETMQARSGGLPKQLRGTYVMIFRRENDGKWRIVSQSWTGAP